LRRRSSSVIGLSCVLPFRHGLVGLMNYVKWILKINFHQSQQTGNSAKKKRKLSQEDTKATEPFFTDRDFTKHRPGFVNFEIFEFTFEKLFVTQCHRKMR
jgi:hypothetical protein